MDHCTHRIIHQERVIKARKAMPASRELDTATQLFKAMGDPTRLKMLLALAQGEMCVCDLAAFLQLTESAISHQLRGLRQLGLVTNRRAGSVLYYRLEEPCISRLIRLALDHAAHVHPQPATAEIRQQA